MRKYGKFTTALMCIAVLICGFALGVIARFYITLPTDSDRMPAGDLAIHFMELGNGNTGDSIFIQCGDTDILVDAGSRTNSVNAISNYINGYMTDNVLEYVIVTHADRDHIAGFAGDNTNTSLFLTYQVQTIIDFPRTNKDTDILNRYYARRDEEVAAGAKHYTALECYNNEGDAKRSYDIGNNVQLEILYNYYYEHDSSDENNYSVCFRIINGDDHYLFTGDLEADGEERLVQNNTLGKCRLYKAGHHGSKTSSNDVLLNVIQPEVCVVTCCAGSVEYTQNLSNTFPTQDFINRISAWTDKVYVTTVGTIHEVDGEWKDLSHASMNGTVVFTVTRGQYNINCTNNNTLLKDAQWFSEYRTMPTAWAA